MSRLLRTENLSIGYQSEIQKELNFDVCAGELLFIKGRNGSGKSTLIKTLDGEIPPRAGRFTWSLDEKGVTTLPQLSNHEFPLSITLGEIIELFKPSKIAENLLGNHLYDRRFNDISGGEKQKILILTRIKEGTSFLILDEPFNHLDKGTISEVMNFLKELLASKVIQGIILISHIDIECNSDSIKEIVLDD